MQVQPKHVKEAFRLLNKSIIRVEQPDIHLEEDQPEEEEQMDVDQGLSGGRARQVTIFFENSGGNYLLFSKGIKVH